MRSKQNQLELAIIAFLLAEPDHAYDKHALRKRLREDPETFEQAIKSLTDHGLVRQNGNSLWPTGPAVRLAEIQRG